MVIFDDGRENPQFFMVIYNDTIFSENAQKAILSAPGTAGRTWLD
jgi:hypothetical protein